MRRALNENGYQRAAIASFLSRNVGTRSISSIDMADCKSERIRQTARVLPHGLSQRTNSLSILTAPDDSLLTFFMSIKTRRFGLLRLSHNSFLIMAISDSSTSIESL